VEAGDGLEHATQTETESTVQKAKKQRWRSLLHMDFFTSHAAACFVQNDPSL